VKWLVEFLELKKLPRRLPKLMLFVLGCALCAMAGATDPDLLPSKERGELRSIACFAAGIGLLALVCWMCSKDGEGIP
jgi:hypothetical protein